jgi:hypothetical protein
MGFNVQPASYGKGAARYLEEPNTSTEDFDRVTVRIAAAALTSQTYGHV